MKVSAHAQERVTQRVGKRASRKAQKLLLMLWNQGRWATSDDLYEFKASRSPRCLYRVAQRAGGRFLVVRDSETDVFITLIKAK
jgi:hypothetical protein